MAIIKGGTTGALQEVESNTKASRVVVLPKDIGALGSYSIVMESGALTGVAANGPVFSLRWTDATRFMVIRRLFGAFATTTAFTTAQALLFDIFFARSFTASDTTGTAATLTGNNGKKRTSFGTTLLGDMRIGATGALTAGTRTLDAQPIDVLVGASTGLGTVQPLTLIGDDNASDYPIILAQNEGIVIQNNIAMGAAGVIKLALGVEWDELTVFP